MSDRAGGLPRLVGAPAQIRYAERVRPHVLKRLRCWLAPNAAAEKARERCYLITDAAFWIDSRNDSARDTARRAWSAYAEDGAKKVDLLKRRRGGEDEGGGSG